MVRYLKIELQEPKRLVGLSLGEIVRFSPVFEVLVIGYHCELG